MRKLLLAGALLMGHTLLLAQEIPESNPKDWKITGSADLYFKADITRKTGLGKTAFTQTHNQFALGMASAQFNYVRPRLQVLADLGFGPRAQEFSYTDEGITQNIKQLFISYAPLKNLTLTAGTWATHLGYEVLDPQYNRQYSMSYLFTNGPFSHTGIKAAFQSGSHSAMLGIANPADFKRVPENGLHKKSILAQYGYTPSSHLKVLVNYVGGQQPDSSRNHSIDLVITGKWNSPFSLAVNGAYTLVGLWNRERQTIDSGKPWWGVAVYLNYDPAPWCGLSWRTELFNDPSHLKSLRDEPLADRVLSNTLSASLKKGNLILMPELRLDRLHNSPFSADQPNRNHDLNWLMALIYSF